VPGRTIAVAVCGWLIAGLVVFWLVSSVGFAAIALIGLLLRFISVRIDVEKDAAGGSGWSADLMGRQHQARERLSEEERASRRHEQSLALGTVRLFRHLGIAQAKGPRACSKSKFQSHEGVSCNRLASISFR